MSRRDQLAELLRVYRDLMRQQEDMIKTFQHLNADGLKDYKLQEDRIREKMEANHATIRRLQKELDSMDQEEK